MRSSGSYLVVILAAVSLVSLPSSAPAQGCGDAATAQQKAVAEAAAQDERTQKVRTNLQTPDPTSNNASPRTRFTLAASREKTRVEAVIGKRLCHMDGGEIQIGLKLGGPIDEKATEATLATLDGLADSTTATFGVKWVAATPERQSQASEILARHGAADVHLHERAAV